MNEQISLNDVVEFFRQKFEGGDQLAGFMADILADFDKLRSLAVVGLYEPNTVHEHGAVGDAYGSRGAVQPFTLIGGLEVLKQRLLREEVEWPQQAMMNMIEEAKDIAEEAPMQEGMVEAEAAMAEAA